MTQDELINELRSLDKQRTEANAQLARIDGAEQMVRHLMAKLAEKKPEAEPEVTPEPAVNGEA